MDRYRVHYYSQHDLSVGWNLQEIEELMTNFDALDFVKDINDALELYHINKYIDHDNFLLNGKSVLHNCFISSYILVPHSFVLNFSIFFFCIAY